MIKSNCVTVNGVLPKKAGDSLKGGETIVVVEAEQMPNVATREQLAIYDEIEVIADTKDYLIVNKPSGLLMHPTQAQEPVSLADWLVRTYPALKGVGEHADRPGIVHRLDKDASGLIVVAKHNDAFAHLKAQFKDRTVEKIYTILVHGEVASEHDTLDFEIDRGTDGRMVARPKTDKLALDKVYKRQPGKNALSEFWVEKRYLNFTLLKVKIHTGRTHQIRVHMYAYNHHVVGDELYHQQRGRKFDKQLGRLFLHATRLGFHDLQGNAVEYETVLPDQLQEFLTKCK